MPAGAFISRCGPNQEVCGGEEEGTSSASPHFRRPCGGSLVRGPVWLASFPVPGVLPDYTDTSHGVQFFDICIFVIYTSYTARECENRSVGTGNVLHAASV